MLGQNAPGMAAGDHGDLAGRLHPQPVQQRARPLSPLVQPAGQAQQLPALLGMGAQSVGQRPQNAGLKFGCRARYGRGQQWQLHVPCGSQQGAGDRLGARCRGGDGDHAPPRQRSQHRVWVARQVPARGRCDGQDVPAARSVPVQTPVGVTHLHVLDHLIHRYAVLCVGGGLRCRQGRGEASPEGVSVYRGGLAYDVRGGSDPAQYRVFPRGGELFQRQHAQFPRRCDVPLRCRSRRTQWWSVVPSGGVRPEARPCKRGGEAPPRAQTVLPVVGSCYALDGCVNERLPMTNGRFVKGPAQVRIAAFK